MKKCSTLLVAALIALGSLPAFAANEKYETAGDKTAYTFNSLSQIAGSGVTKENGVYLLSKDLYISATDTIRIEDGDEVRFGDKILIRISGYGDFAPANGATLTRKGDTDSPKGIQYFGEESFGSVKNITFEYCGLKYGGKDGFTVDNCSFTNVSTTLSSAGVLTFSGQSNDVVISNCTFENNEATALGGAANYTCGVTVKDCYFYDCNQKNANRPFINLTVGGKYPVVIENNTIIGNKRTKVGGIAVSNLLGFSSTNKVYIRNNSITNCRYGLTTTGAMDAVISGNKLINNHYEPNPNNGGSGISLYDSTKKQNAVVTGNQIEGNIWGITVIGCNEVNLGKTTVDPTASDYNPGGNVFRHNSNSGVAYDLYNNSTNTIHAQGNVWSVDTQDSVSIEGVITHKNDISSLGEVIFMPAKTDSLPHGAPHGLTAATSFQTVTLNWLSPSESKEIKWHDGEDYNGYSAAQTDPESACSFIGGAKFTADELQEYAGYRVDTLAYFEYRNIYEAYAQIYEDGVLIMNQKVDLSNYTKNSWRKVALNEPYFIKSDKEVIFAIKFMHGLNQDFVGITDRTSTGGKGNLVSLDEGKTWSADAPGDFLITAIVKSFPTTEPNGYNVYRNGELLNDTLITVKTATLVEEPEGTNTYIVTSVYPDEEILSASVDATSKSVLKVFPAVSTISGSVSDGLTGTVTWTDPLTRSSELTWAGKENGNKIGATASSPKVWIKQEFDENDLVAYPNHQITAINAYISEASITGTTLFVIKNGVIDYYETVSSDSIALITANSWFKFKLSKPYVLEQGNTYSFGCYYTHSKSTKPVGTDNTTAIEKKGNMFATSSPNSKNFANSKPLWKTLSSGGIAGNFMLSADVEALDSVGDAPVVASYNIYRDNQLIKSGVTEKTYTETTDELGSFTYSVEAVGTNGYVSARKDVTLTYTLPAAIAAPVITSNSFDSDSKKFDMAWSNDAIDLKHYATPSYMGGFSEDMDLIYGAKFSADELSQLSGYTINSIKFGIGAALSSFKIEIYAGSEKLYSEEISGSEVSAKTLYSLTLGNPVSIPAGKDLYIVYNASIPANTNALILDGGPAVDGGAMISLTNGSSWLKLGTIASSYANYNIVIGATAAPNAASTTPAKEITLGNALFTENSNNSLIATVEEYGIAADEETAAVEKTAKVKDESTTKYTVSGYRVYRNSELVKEITTVDEKSYSETIGTYGEFNYNVANVYSNGWESPLSKTVSIENFIPQKSAAPYNLQGNVSGKDLNLTWETVDADAAVLKYHTGDEDMKIGMTKTSGTVEGYQAIRFTADTLAKMNKVGDKITHIRFKLASRNIYTASVFVMYNEDIMFEQPIDTANVVVGWNTIRLNKAITVPEGLDISLGYHLTYATGEKPLSIDKGPSTLPGYSDLISASASYGYWYSLKTKYKQDYNFRIEGIFQKAGQDLEGVDAAEATSTTTYNVYRDGTVIATGVSEKAYTVKDAETGAYTVTAVDGEVESAESNAVNFTAAGIVDNIAAGKAYYDREADAVILPATGDAKVYSANGTLIKSESEVERVDLSDVASGVYVVKTATGVLKVVK